MKPTQYCVCMYNAVVELDFAVSPKPWNSPAHAFRLVTVAWRYRAVHVQYSVQLQERALAFAFSWSNPSVRRKGLRHGQGNSVSLSHFHQVVSLHPGQRIPSLWREEQAGQRQSTGRRRLPPPGSDPLLFRPCRHLLDLLARRATAACIMQLGSLAKRTGVAGWHGTKKLRCGWDPSPGRWRMDGSVSYRLALTMYTSHPLPSAWVPVTQPRRYPVLALGNSQRTLLCRFVVCPCTPSD